MSLNVVREYYLIIKNKIKHCYFETAILNIDKLLSVYPKDEHAYYFKGLCKFALNDYRNAIINYNTAIKLNPAYAKAYFNLGVTFYVIKDYDKALINIAKALIIFEKRKELDKKQRAIDALNLIKKERGA